MKEKIIALCSGGFDSVVMLHELDYYCKHTGSELYLMHFGYGQRAEKQENEITINLVKKLGINPAHTIGFNIPVFPSWSKTSNMLRDGEYRTPWDNSLQCLPMRNMIFLSYALAWAKTIGATKIYSAILHSDFDDTKASFLENMKYLGADVGVDFMFPYANKYKWELMPLAKQFGIDLYDFFSCNVPDPVSGNPCGECADCRTILEMFNKPLDEKGNL